MKSPSIWDILNSPLCLLTTSFIFCKPKPWFKRSLFVVRTLLFFILILYNKTWHIQNNRSIIRQQGIFSRAFFRQGATAPIRWQVPPVMMEGESELPNWRIPTAETKGKTNNSVKAESRIESARLNQVKNRPFFLCCGAKSVAFMQSLIRSSWKTDGFML